MYIHFNRTTTLRKLFNLVSANELVQATSVKMFLIYLLGVLEAGSHDHFAQKSEVQATLRKRL